jgi:FkbM family methyltransferase
MAEDEEARRLQLQLEAQHYRRHLALDAIALDTRFFQHAADDLRNDHAIATLAISLSAGNFRFVSDELKDDKEIGLFAVSCKSTNVALLSMRLQADEDIKAVALRSRLQERGVAVCTPTSSVISDAFAKRTNILNLMHRAADTRSEHQHSMILDELIGPPLPGERKKRKRDYHDLAFSWRLVKDSLPAEDPLQLAYCRPNVRSDVLVACEIFEGTKAYKPWASQALCGLLGLRPGDVVADVGANAGFFAFFACGEMHGKGKIRCYEPSVFTGCLLEHNVASLRSENMEIEVFQNMVTANGGVEMLDDHTFTAWGAARSSSSKKNPYDFQAKGLRRYEVTALPFADIIQDCTVLKLDIERSELAMLSAKSNEYKNVRLLYAEISRKWLVKKNPTGNGWIKMSQILSALGKAGFEFIDMPPAAFDIHFWRRRENDFMIVAYRPYDDRRKQLFGQLSEQLTERDVKKLTRWRHFRRDIKEQLQEAVIFPKVQCLRPLDVVAVVVVDVVVVVVVVVCCCCCCSCCCCCCCCCCCTCDGRRLRNFIQEVR